MQELILYLQKRIRAGIPKKGIEEEVSAVGWRASDFEHAYAKALVAEGAPLPSGNTSGFGERASALDVALHLFSFIALGASVGALGTLLFSLIEHFFPDALMTYDWYSYQGANDAIHYAIAVLFVAFPAYYASMRYRLATFRVDGNKTETRLDLWLTYLVLLVALLTAGGDIIAVVYSALKGEVTIRFLLKALVIFVLAGGVFAFYFLERIVVQYKKTIARRTFQVFGVVWIGIVIASIVVGFFVAGNPHQARKQGFDQKRVDALTSIAGCIESYAYENHRLPDTVQDFAQDTTRAIPYGAYYGACDMSTVQDPETSVPYDYRIVIPLAETREGIYEGSFELCAIFSTDTENGDMKGGVVTGSKWADHPMGRACDTEKVSFSFSALRE
jgi:hypothetical protein